MSSKEEKGKKSKDKKIEQSKKISEDQNIIIIYEYTKDRYKEMLKKKKDIDKHTLYLFISIRWTKTTSRYSESIVIRS